MKLTSNYVLVATVPLKINNSLREAVEELSHRIMESFIFIQIYKDYKWKTTYKEPETDFLVSAEVVLGIINYKIQAQTIEVKRDKENKKITAKIVLNMEGLGNFNKTYWVVNLVELENALLHEFQHTIDPKYGMPGKKPPDGLKDPIGYMNSDIEMSAWQSEYYLILERKRKQGWTREEALNELRKPFKQSIFKVGISLNPKNQRLFRRRMYTVINLIWDGLFDK